MSCPFSLAVPGNSLQIRLRSVCRFTFAFVALIVLTSSARIQAQSSYDPPTSESFSQAISGMTTVNYYTFGSSSTNNITNLTQLAASFNPYGIANTTVINQEWERYQGFNSSNFVFAPNSLNLTATIPSSGGLYDGGINSGQIWSKQTYQPGKTGQNVYAMSIRMKIPNGVGAWPAAWLMAVRNSDSSEVDIAEFEMMQYQDQFDWTGDNHGPGAGNAFYSLLTNPWVWHPGTDFSADFHNYQIIWTPDATFKYMDDQLIYAEYFQWTSSQPAQLGVNLAMGSYQTSLYGLIPNSLSEFPESLQLQSITIWGGSGSSTPAPSPSAAASVSYAGLDTTTQGSWNGQYGGDGYQIANGATKVPSYANVSVTGDATYTWAGSTTDTRALQIGGGSNARMASTYYSSSSFNINVNITDGNSHRVSLYMLDWDGSGRAETVTVLDASSYTVLDRESFANFYYGQYASWNVKGNVIFQIAPSNGGTATVSGIFFGPAGSAAPPPTPVSSSFATYGGIDSGTEGMWTGKYGNDGYVIANDATNVPYYATISAQGASSYTWAQQTTDSRALQSYGGSPVSIASTYYSSGTFTLNLNLTDGNAHRISLYLLDWDTYSRAESVKILDAETGAVLDTETFSGFHDGKYAIWNIKGNVTIQIAPTVYGTSALSGLFFN